MRRLIYGLATRNLLIHCSFAWSFSSPCSSVSTIDASQITIENFPTLSGILRLAYKYRVARLQNDVLARLRAAWPSALDKHLARARALTALRASQPHTEDLIVHPAAVIALLRSINCADNALLTALFYDLSRRTPQLGGAGGHHLAPLSAADIERLVLGGARLRSAHVNLSIAGPALTANPVHQMSCHALVSGFWYSPAGQRCLLNTQDLMSQPVEDWELVKGLVQGTLALPGLSLTGLCSTCRAEVVKYVGQQQATLWGSLSRHFDLADH